MAKKSNWVFTQDSSGQITGIKKIDDKMQVDKLHAENERLKKEIAEWELSIKAAKESIEGRNDVIKALDSKSARIRTFALKALETIKVTAEANEEVLGYDLKDLIQLCDKFKKEIKGE